MGDTINNNMIKYMRNNFSYMAASAQSKVARSLSVAPVVSVTRGPGLVGLLDVIGCIVPEDPFWAGQCVRLKHGNLGFLYGCGYNCN